MQPPAYVFKVIDTYLQLVHLFVSNNYNQQRRHLNYFCSLNNYIF